MTKIIKFFILLTTSVVFSQSNFEGQALYSVSTTPIDINILTDKELPESMKKLTESLFNPKDDLNCILYFSKTESIFFKSKKLNNPNKKKTITDILIGNGKYYAEAKKKKILQQREFMGDLFLIESEFFNWTLTQEEKKIGKYTCYKAIGVRIIENSKGTFKKDVIAWYTPEIPTFFGPKNYCGLPGLIVSLKDGDLFFNLKKIKLNPKKKIKIKRPSKGKKMSLLEYELLMKRLFYEKKNN
tara:strand:+ start:3196 stop:3921 length:726 start_codon:yes stop_codon:yes gene_type:complete